VTTGLYENKFGISNHEFDKLIEFIQKSEHINFFGLHFHIGSQITRVEEVFSLECKRVNDIVKYFESKGLTVNNINLGGGLGVDYDDPDGNPIADFETWFKAISDNIVRRPNQNLHVEPGRSLVAQCASLISRVLFVKSGETKNFLIMDAGMNDLIRPALYGAYHKIENLSATQRSFFPTFQAYDIVGPVCESSDVWGAGRLLPLSVRGDLMAIRSTGAYGQVMASRYNMKDLAPSVFSDMLDEAPEAVDYFNLTSRA
jgi:diaminopimelate decarboxylase